MRRITQCMDWMCVAATLIAAMAAGCGGNNTSASNLPLPPVPATVTWPAPASIVYGTALTATQLDASANVPGAFVYTPTAGTVPAVGQDTLSVTFTPTDLTDYAAVTQTTTIAVTAAAAPSYSWNNVQIVGGGFVTGIVTHPSQQNSRYVRTDIGGAYRWNQTAGTWTPITDFISRSNSNDIGIESIGLDPNDPQRLYLAVGTYAESFGTNGAFLLSDDQGATFTTVAAPFKMGSNDNGRYAGERLAVDPNLGTTLYFGTRNNGLWRSLDRGNTWAQVTSFPVASTTGGVGIVFIDFLESSGASGSATPVIYAGVSDIGTGTPGYSSLYRSIDAGVTWQAVPGQPTGMYPSHGVIGPDNAMYLSYGNGVGPAGITAGALWKYQLPAGSSPGGAGAWTNITPGTSVRPSYSQGGFGAVAVDPERSGVVMASTIDDYYPGDDIYRSVNYGANWVSLNQQGVLHNVSLSPWVTFGASIAGIGNWAGTLVIDPFNSNHVMYGTGQTVWDSANMSTTSDAGVAPTFNIGAVGIEETAVLQLISPPSGADLVSGVGDIGGFVHTSLTASPAAGMSSNPILSNTTGLDFAQNLPAMLVRVGSNSSSNQFGAYSTNGGTTWTPFPTLPATTAGQGSIAIAVDGSAIVWAPSDGPVAYTTNLGTTWTNSTGATAESDIVADRVNPKKFYIYNSSSGTLQISTDGGVTFASTAAALPQGGYFVASYAAEGDLWLASTNGLYHSTNSGASFTASTSVAPAYSIGFGKAAAGASYPAIYVIGTSGGTYGFFRSTYGGNTWVQMNDAAHQYGYCSIILGDPRIFARVYIGCNGRGIVYGDSPN